MPDFQLGLDHLDALTQFDQYRSLPSLIYHASTKTEKFKSFSNVVTGLYRAIQAMTGKPIVLDSSKNPVRAIALTYMDQIDLKVIHLVRDGRGVAWSLKKSYKKDITHGIQHDLPARPVYRTALFWRLTNVCSELAMKNAGEAACLRIRYEDLISDPVNTLESLGNLCDLDFSDLALRLERGDAFDVGHTVAGSRIRMEGRIRMLPDLEWEENLTAVDKMIFWVLAGRMAKRYGYHFL